MCIFVVVNSIIQTCYLKRCMDPSVPKMSYFGHHRPFLSDYIFLFPPGSPKRRPFQRQRAASDNTDPTEEDSPPPHPSPPLRRDIIQPLPPAHSQSSGLQRLSAGSLSSPTCPPSPCLSRYHSQTLTSNKQYYTHIGYRGTH